MPVFVTYSSNNVKSREDVIKLLKKSVSIGRTALLTNFNIQLKIQKDLNGKN